MNGGPGARRRKNGCDLLLLLSSLLMESMGGPGQGEGRVGVTFCSSQDTWELYVFNTLPFSSTVTMLEGIHAQRRSLFGSYFKFKSPTVRWVEGESTKFKPVSFELQLMFGGGILEYGTTLFPLFLSPSPLNLNPKQLIIR